MYSPSCNLTVANFVDIKNQCQDRLSRQFPCRSKINYVLWKMALNSGCVVSFQETISHLIQLQTATKKRIAEIKECETRIEKAFGYLTKVL